jgi:cytosol alanyl aminopeptidase
VRNRNAAPVRRAYPLGDGTRNLTLEEADDSLRGPLSPALDSIARHARLVRMRTPVLDLRRATAAGFLLIATTASALPAAAQTAPGRLGHDVVPTAQAVRLALDPRAADYRGSVRIDLQVKRRTSSFRFHSEGLRIARLRLTRDGKDVAATAGPEQDGMVSVRASAPLAPGAYVLAIDFVNDFDTRAASLYRLQSQGEWYAFTQFQSTDAREAFPCWDEPEFKIPWEVTLLVPKEHVAIANTPVERETEYQGTKTIVYRRSPPLPSYLVAFAVGPFELVPIGGLSVPGHVVVCKGQSQLAAEAARITPPLLKSLEDYFGQPYPFEKCDLLAVPEYWYGAMENPGAITFVDRILLIDPATASSAQRRRLVEIMAHELAHMWFGDLVTMKWWDDLWLNESFASWMGDKIAAQVYPQFQTELGDIENANDALRIDARPSTRAMRQKVGVAENLDQLADDLAYDKGQVVLGMFEQYLSRDVFRDGVQRFLRAHAWGNAEAGDLWKALGEAAGRELAQPMGTFLDQPGMPLVTAELKGDGTLELTQKRFFNAAHAQPSTQLWSIPVTLRYSDGAAIHTQTVLLEQASATVTLNTGAATRWVLPHAEARGYYRWSVSPALLDALGDEALPHLSARERVAFVYNLSALLDAGLVRGDQFLRLLARFAADEEPKVVSAVCDALDQVRDAFSTPATAASFAAWVRSALRPALDRIGVLSRPEDTEGAAELRPRLFERLADLGADAELRGQAATMVRAHLDSGAPLDPAIGDVVVRVAAYEGDRALFTAYRQRFEAATAPIERRRFLEGLGRFRAAGLPDSALTYALAGPLRPQEVSVIPRGLREHPPLAAKVYRWMAANYDALTSRMPAAFAVYMPYYADGCSLDLLGKAESFFDEPSHRPAGTEKELAQVRDRVKDCAALQAREGAAVAEYLTRISEAKED